ncbi:MAG TPA: radical SAM protein [Acidobacteriota bacterium]|nr:radical SAM protein [Acidobacteriota bacterium]
MTRPRYTSLSPRQWRLRVERALEELRDCRACPRDCGVNRLEDKWAACKTGRYAVVSSAFPHFGEEDVLRGWRGSGTIFFSHCNLRCVFCQNYDISQAIPAVSRGPARGAVSGGGRSGPGAEGVTPDQLAGLMLDLQARGCHNINFVTPEHVAPQVVEGLAQAVPKGLKLPVVYNTSAYDALSSLELMDGLVDIYMPDFKYWREDSSKRYMKAADYPSSARAAIKAMHEQVGPLEIGSDGLARQGLLIRHLVMPGGLEETRRILQWVADELGPGSYVNVMAQYYPAGAVDPKRHPELTRRPDATEILTAKSWARDLGLRVDARN